VTTAVVYVTRPWYNQEVKKPMKQAIKIPAESLDRLRDLAAECARYGWAAFGIDRTDLPTQTALIEEAIKLLAERREQIKQGKGKR